ncbi:MAG: mechanosensitive ion channel protein [Deltaproteobacteria bacterium HGW-Deltaproteobacteria-15]|jgi:small conductance mechanosensitive channel|nr:MAG: mechanosensitive ion channel protein [Deltaproteobacteria bacterium HGW-Deltaproteobacteria-15]
MTDMADQILVFLTTYGIKIVGAIIILLFGRLGAGVGRKFVRSMLEKSKADPAIISFSENVTYFLILTFAVLAALAKFGIQTASFIAVLGAAGFAIGFALQGSLANFAAGVLILVLRPFKIGDYIMGAGEAGTVKEIALFTTVLATPDNVKIMVPNGKLFGDTIKNVSAFDTRRIDLVIGIGYGSDIQKAHDVIREVIRKDDRVLRDPTAQVAVSELADSSVNLVIRPWVRKEDYWDVRFDLTRKLKEAFDANGIEIPFPQRVVHAIPNSSLDSHHAEKAREPEPPLRPSIAGGETLLSPHEISVKKGVGL